MRKAGNKKAPDASTSAGQNLNIEK